MDDAERDGIIRKGEEEDHSLMFFPMESDVLKIHRVYSGSNSRGPGEAIGLVLFDIKSRVSGEKASFDTFTNEEIREELGQMDAEHLHDYYKEPVM